jgi:hypothetical protein
MHSKLNTEVFTNVGQEDYRYDSLPIGKFEDKEVHTVYTI